MKSAASVRDELLEQVERTKAHLRVIAFDESRDWRELTTTRCRGKRRLSNDPVIITDVFEFEGLLYARHRMKTVLSVSELRTVFLNKRNHRRAWMAPWESWEDLEELRGGPLRSRLTRLRITRWWPFMTVEMTQVEDFSESGDEFVQVHMACPDSLRNRLVSPRSRTGSPSILSLPLSPLRYSGMF
mmetsp:Transcript_23088/g.38676  ORF Transcript_23088/g.38676 Transcript_23088/m.38676 type:complete len:186 (-) Transcript_23088:735-1292(-)